MAVGLLSACFAAVEAPAAWLSLVPALLCPCFGPTPVVSVSIDDAPLSPKLPVPLLMRRMA